MPDYPETVAPVGDPNYQAAQDEYGEFRVLSWRLEKDFSITITGRTTHNDVYNLAYGPKPADGQPDPLPVEDQFAPAAWTFAAESFQDGLLRLNRFACGEYGDSVHMGVFEVYFIRESENRYGTIVGTIESTATSFQYSGAPPVAGEWVMADAELMYVKTVTPTEPNFGDVTVERGVLGTEAAAHSRVSSVCSAKDPDHDSKYTVEPGKDFRPGANLVVNDGEGEPYDQFPIAGYDAESGEIRTTLPLATLDVGDPVYSDVRLWRVCRQDVVINFQPRFFRSPARALFEHVVQLPMAGVVMIRGKLINTRGVESDYVVAMPSSSQRMEPVELPFAPAWPYRVRTGGGHRFLLDYSGHDRTLSVHELNPALAAHAQPFERAYAQVSGLGPNTIQPPPGIASVLRSSLSGSGSLLIGGAINGSALIGVAVSGANAVTAPTWIAADHGIDEDSTAENVAASLADWLNADPHFRAFFDASASDDIVTITDKTAGGGTIEAEATGGVTVTASGFTSQFGVLTGRRYALAYKARSFRSALSPLSNSTEPTGDATRLDIKDVPASPDSRVTHVEIYAAPDGQDEPMYLVASVNNGVGHAADTVPESDLAAQPQDPGESQPETGPITVTLTKNGDDWAKLFIPGGRSTSEEIHGFALDPVAEDTVINAKIDNSVGVAGTDVQIFIV
ncbi:MAG: hypothetical protein ACK5AZ_25600 [Bryobacteraceae bacterium]